jgi:diketogulonate reductase-like aldo/keto reductase
MEECQKKGLTRNLGLSNFNEMQIAKIISSCTIKPQVLQVELHAYFQQMDLRRFCAENDIVVTAYAPLGSPGAKTHFVTKYNYRYVVSFCREHTLMNYREVGSYRWYLLISHAAYESNYEKYLISKFII